MDVGIRNNLGKSARSAGKKDIAKKKPPIKKKSQTYDRLFSFGY